MKQVEDELKFRWMPADKTNPARLPNIVVNVHPVMRDAIIPKGHLYSFQAPNTTTDIPLFNKAGTSTLKNLFKRSGENSHQIELEERLWLEKELGMKLNPYSADSDLHKYKVKINHTIKDAPLALNLANPRDYLDFLILSHSGLCTPLNTPSLKSAARVKYYLETEDFKEKNTNTRTSDMRKAFRYLGSIEGSVAKMRTFYKIATTKTPSPNIKREKLLEMLEELAQTEGKKFVEIMENPSYQMQEFLVQAVEIGAVVFEKGGYYFNGEPMKFEGDAKADLGAAIKFLQAAENQPIKADIQNKISIANN